MKDRLFYNKMLVYIITFTLLFAIFTSLPFNVAAEEGEIIIQDQIIETVDEWFVEDTGTNFNIDSSNYIDLIITSSQNVDIFLESAFGLICYHVKGDGTVDFTDITLTGFLPDTTYYMSQDDEESVAFRTDSSGVYTYTQDLSSDHLVTIQEDASTIYILSNDSITSEV